MITSLLLSMPESMRAGMAKEVFHTFVIGVYFFPLLGGWLSDRFYGKYHTIFWLSLVYCAGHACLAIFDDNLWVLLTNSSVKSAAVNAQISSTGMSMTAFQMFYFAGFALLAALAFALYAKSYPVVDNYRSAK